jgi:hypothetical protein
MLLIHIHYTHLCEHIAAPEVVPHQLLPVKLGGEHVDVLLDLHINQKLHNE